MCLAKTDDCTPPSCNERATLAIAGLGEKKVSFSLNGDASDFTSTILKEFPKLTGGGGFEILRQDSGSGKILKPLPVPPSGYSAEFIKGVIAQAKAYLRPLQRNLPTDAAINDEVCILFLWGLGPT